MSNIALRKNANRVRSIVLMHGESVTLAAKKLDIGRSALSNVINAKAELSIELALKIEQVYGYDAIDLLTRQLVDQVEEVKYAGLTFPRVLDLDVSGVDFVFKLLRGNDSGDNSKK